MLISHRHRFIFIKTKKTAGTSIEIALSKFLGPRDVITHISPEDEEIRRSLGYPGPQNYHLPLTRLRGADWRAWLATRQRPYYYNHMGAEDIRRYAGDKVWNGYFKFCFERNPWDKVISWYYWEHPREPRPPLAEFIRAGRAAELCGPGGADLYSIGGRTAVDRVYRYEQLDEAMRELAARFGFPERPALPRAKSRFRSDRRPYREVYGPEREAVAHIFDRQLREFGYEF